jgi:hypothetical protein
MKGALMTKIRRFVLRRDIRPALKPILLLRTAEVALLRASQDLRVPPHEQDSLKVRLQRLYGR